MQSVRKFRAEFESIIASLELLECTISGVPSAEAIVISMILNKMPKDLRDNMKRSLGDKIISLSHFRVSLKQELDILCTNSEVASNSNISPGKVNNSNKIKSEFKDIQSTASSFSVSVDAENPNSYASRPKNKTNARPNQLYCHFCDVVGHSSTSCATYPDFDSRMDRLKSFDNRCTKCWFRLHGNQPCVNLKCRLCNQSHWSAICNSSHSKENNTTINHISDKKTVVALPTFTAFCNGKPVRALLDQCSQRTLILSSTVKRLNLPILKKEFLNLSGYENNVTSRLFEIACCSLGSNDRFIDVSALVVDKLPDINVEGIDLVADSLVKKQIKLADKNLTSPVISDIDLLIGSDFYYEFVKTNELPVNIDHVWLIPTYFGYCISGKLPIKDFQTSISNNVVVLKIGAQNLNLDNDERDIDML